MYKTTLTAQSQEVHVQESDPPTLLRLHPFLHKCGYDVIYYKLILINFKLFICAPKPNHVPMRQPRQSLVLS